MTKKLFKVPIGDWSQDGHNQYQNFYVTANYPAKDMREAYKETCKKIGLQMNHSDNYMGIKDATSFRSEDKWRILLAEYEESSIDERAVEILLSHGFDFKRVDGDRDENDKIIIQEVYFDAEGVFDLFMWFVSYSMPEDFKYEQFKLDAESIVGWWCDGLNHQIGYGIFY